MSYNLKTVTTRKLVSGDVIQSSSRWDGLILLDKVTTISGETSAKDRIILTSEGEEFSLPADEQVLRVTNAQFDCHPDERWHVWLGDIGTKGDTKHQALSRAYHLTEADYDC